jgi:hypothetical protein
MARYSAANGQSHEYLVKNPICFDRFEAAFATIEDGVAGQRRIMLTLWKRGWRE